MTSWLDGARWALLGVSPTFSGFPPTATTDKSDQVDGRDFSHRNHVSLIRVQTRRRIVCEGMEHGKKVLYLWTSLPTLERSDVSLSEIVRVGGAPLAAGGRCGSSSLEKDLRAGGASPRWQEANVSVGRSSILDIRRRQVCAKWPHRRITLVLVQPPAALGN